MIVIVLDMHNSNFTYKYPIINKLTGKYKGMYIHTFSVVNWKEEVIYTSLKDLGKIHMLTNPNQSIRKLNYLLSCEK